ncbi:histone-like nucleoid-structuring protein Lsr2 [Nocardiopsis sp. JB363]|uniref:Lsr2 dimerization domain-containing protein n=1 Tax=Nocardiopsis sp. JB363 TaxID=1434837 RepID=UPI000B35CDEA|nr:histone-like nucleoid-structuring protein Lsr2 [Nocardiopsis sp. JB363]
MAIRRVIESDISGEPDAATFTFGVGDQWYEVDLTTEEREKLEVSLKEYMKVGRKASKEPGKKKVVPNTTTEERERIRKWAKDNGHEVAEYGRIRKGIFKAYWDAHGGPPKDDPYDS